MKLTHPIMVMVYLAVIVGVAATFAPTADGQGGGTVIAFFLLIGAGVAALFRSIP